MKETKWEKLDRIRYVCQNPACACACAHKCMSASYPANLGALQTPMCRVSFPAELLSYQNILTTPKTFLPSSVRTSTRSPTTAQTSDLVAPGTSSPEEEEAKSSSSLSRALRRLVRPVVVCIVPS